MSIVERYRKVRVPALSALEQVWARLEAAERRRVARAAQQVAAGQLLLHDPEMRLMMGPEQEAEAYARLNDLEATIGLPPTPYVDVPKQEFVKQIHAGQVTVAERALPAGERETLLDELADATIARFGTTRVARYLVDQRNQQTLARAAMSQGQGKPEAEATESPMGAGQWVRSLIEPYAPAAAPPAAPEQAQQAEGLARSAAPRQLPKPMTAREAAAPVTAPMVSGPLAVTPPTAQPVASAPTGKPGAGKPATQPAGKPRRRGTASEPPAWVSEIPAELEWPAELEVPAAPAPSMTGYRLGELVTPGGPAEAALPDRAADQPAGEPPAPRPDALLRQVGAKRMVAAAPTTEARVAASDTGTEPPGAAVREQVVQAGAAAREAEREFGYKAEPWFLFGVGSSALGGLPSLVVPLPEDPDQREAIAAGSYVGALVPAGWASKFLAPLRDGPTPWVRPLGKALKTGGEVGVYQASAAAAQGAPPEEAAQEGWSGVAEGTVLGLGAEALAPVAGAAERVLGPRRPAAQLARGWGRPAHVPEKEWQQALEAADEGLRLKRVVDAEGRAAAQVVGAEYEPGSAKTPLRLWEKWRSKVKDDPTYTVWSAKDLARGRITAQRWNDLKPVIEDLERRGYTIEAHINEPWNPSGYRGIHATKRVDGSSVEIQLTTPEHWALKKESDAVSHATRPMAVKDLSPDERLVLQQRLDEMHQRWDTFASERIPDSFKRWISSRERR